MGDHSGWSKNTRLPHQVNRLATPLVAMREC